MDVGKGSKIDLTAANEANHPPLPINPNMNHLRTRAVVSWEINVGCNVVGNEPFEFSLWIGRTVTAQ